PPGALAEVGAGGGAAANTITRKAIFPVPLQSAPPLPLACHSPDTSTDSLAPFGSLATVTFRTNVTAATPPPSAVMPTSGSALAEAGLMLAVTSQDSPTNGDTVMAPSLPPRVSVIT